MGLFDIFRKQEDIYYRDFKNSVNCLDKNDKKTISSLRTRVMTIESIIQKLIKESGSDKLNANESNDTDLKINALRKILDESKKDFIEGVTIKFKEIDENDIPSTFEECNKFSLAIERKQWGNGRHIALEEIKKV